LFGVPGYIWIVEKYILASIVPPFTFFIFRYWTLGGAVWSLISVIGRVTILKVYFLRGWLVQDYIPLFIIRKRDWRLRWCRLGFKLAFIDKITDVHSSCHDVHTFFVELINGPCEVKEMESVSNSNSEILHFEIEPVHVTFGIGINFHQQVVSLAIVDISGVDVATFKILIKYQDLWFIDVLRESCIVISL